MPLSRTLITFLTFLSLPSCAGDSETASAANRAAPDQTALAAALQANVDQHQRAGVTGIVAQINDGDAVIRARAGMSNLEGAEPLAFDTHFRMGSNTKTFIAVVVLQLVSEGILGLGDSVEQWLPGMVSGNGHDGARVTIRDLLQHTSGIPNYTADLLGTFGEADYYRTRYEVTSPLDLIALALSHPPDFAPGSSWHYSNTNYVLAGMIIEKATGRDWPSEVRARIVTPLGLTETTEPGDDPDLPAPHAQGYHLFAEGEPLVDVTTYNHTWAGAAGSLVTTLDDLARFWRALLGGELLGPAELAEMQTTTPALDLEAIIPGARYGLGILQIPTTCGGYYWSHFGDTFGFSTRNAVSDDGSRSVIVSNSTTFDVGPVLQVINDDLQLLDDAMCAP